MKKALLIFAGILFFTACQKKSVHTNEYECISYDSLTSNVPVLENAHAYPGDNFHSGYTQDMINVFVKEHIYVDTFYHHDTMYVDHWQMSCTLDD